MTGFRIEGGRVRGVETSRGYIAAGKVGMAVAGRSSQVGAMAGLRLPIESHVLQAFVTEGLKPVLPGVVTFGMGHFYISQSDKGGLVFGGDLDFYNSYAARGNLPTVEHVMEAGMALMPMIGKARVLRSWGGIVDMTMDGSPIIDRTPVEGLFFNGGWCYGGFKATPASGWCFAHLIATGEPHPAAARLRHGPVRDAGWCWTRRGPVPSRTCTEPASVVGAVAAPTARRRRRRPRCRPGRRPRCRRRRRRGRRWRRGSVALSPQADKARSGARQAVAARVRIFVSPGIATFGARTRGRRIWLPGRRCG